MDIIYSGNAVVDALAKMNFTGNIIPQAWHQTVILENGQPNLTAVVILSDIVYWYRPSEQRNEVDGSIVFKKRFADKDYLQRSYQQISQQQGITKRQATNAIVFLEKEIGVIKRHFKTVTTKTGAIVPNVMYIELFPDRLKELTFPSKEEGVSL